MPLNVIWCTLKFMKEIELSQGKFALVDDEDFDYLNQWKWTLSNQVNHMYACRNRYYRIDGKQKTQYIRMHRLLMGVTDPKIQVDHINHDGLDNRRENLRICTNAENCRNRRKIKGTHTSIYKGVDWEGRNKTSPWRVQVMTEQKKRITVGYFKTEIEAAIAYNEAALKYHGEFAYLNEI